MQSNKSNGATGNSPHKLSCQKISANVTQRQLNAKAAWFNCQTFSAIAKPILNAIAERGEAMLHLSARLPGSWHYNLKLPNANDIAYQSQHTRTRSKRWDCRARLWVVSCGWHRAAQWAAAGSWSAQFAVNELVIQWHAYALREEMIAVAQRQRQHLAHLAWPGRACWLLPTLCPAACLPACLTVNSNHC